LALADVILTAWLATFLMWRRSEAAHGEAQTNLAAAERNLDLAVAAVNQFGAKVSDDLRLKEQDLRPLRKELLTTAVDFHQQLLALRDNSDLARIDLARSYHNLAKLTAEVEAFDRAKTLFLQGNAEFEAYLTEHPDDTSTQYELCASLGQLARLLVDLGESADAEPHFERAIGTLTSLLASEPDQPTVRAQYAA
jgi:tetratricopeptide (TPR) repeat protein